MGSTNKCERELERGIDAMIDEMNGRYCSELEEEAMIDIKLADIKLRNEIIDQIKEEIRCKKVSESIMKDQLKEVVYTMETRISGNGLLFGQVNRNAIVPSLEQSI